MQRYRREWSRSGTATARRALLAAAVALLAPGCKSDVPASAPVAPAPIAPAAAPLAAAPLAAGPARNALLRQAIDAVQIAQCEGDLDQHRRADRIAGELIDRYGPDATVLAVRAAAHAGLHRFAEAVELADRAIALNPYDPAPYGALADALIELGDYERALQTVQYLLDLKPTHAAYARAAYLRTLHGDQAGGLRLMRLAADAAPSNAPAERAWHLAHLGQDALAAGEIGTAEDAFKQVLALRPGDDGALQGLAAIAAGRGDFDGAIALYTEVTAQGPAPDAHAALADLYTVLGSAADAGRHFRAAERAELAELEGMEQPERRHLALLYADHGVERAEALRLAEQDAAHRDDIYTADTLAWTLYHAGRIREAREASLRALRLGTRDPLLHYRAGMIAAAAGERAEAQRLLGSALTREAALGPLRVERARAALTEQNPPPRDIQGAQFSLR